MGDKDQDIGRTAVAKAQNASKAMSIERNTITKLTSDNSVSSDGGPSY